MEKCQTVAMYLIGVGFLMGVILWGECTRSTNSEVPISGDDDYIDLDTGVAYHEVPLIEEEDLPDAVTTLVEMQGDIIVQAVESWAVELMITEEAFGKAVMKYVQMPVGDYETNAGELIPMRRMNKFGILEDVDGAACQMVDVSGYDYVRPIVWFAVPDGYVFCDVRAGGVDLRVVVRVVHR